MFDEKVQSTLRAHPVSGFLRVFLALRGAIFLRRSEMERLLNTVQYLKGLVERREEGWTRGFERQCHYQVIHLHHLEPP